MNKNNMKMAALLVTFAACFAIFSSCKKDNPEPDSLVYIENGQNCGKGIAIGNVVWAPVNCGHDADHLFGKLYQWGRKDGQGYDGEPSEPTIEEGAPASLGDAKADTFYKGWPTYDKDIWGPSGSGNPCPAGWRVPTYSELETLRVLAEAQGEWVIEKGIQCYKIPVGDAALFIPSAGYRDIQGKAVKRQQKSASLWSCSHIESGNPYSNLYLDNTTVSIDYDVQSLGLSVRCVKTLE